jgi:hypothetical protein
MDLFVGLEQHGKINEESGIKAKQVLGTHHTFGWTANRSDYRYPLLISI